jgi:hypothetical protein
MHYITTYKFKCDFLIQIRAAQVLFTILHIIREYVKFRLIIIL